MDGAESAPGQATPSGERPQPQEGIYAVEVARMAEELLKKGRLDICGGPGTGRTTLAQGVRTHAGYDPAHTLSLEQGNFPKTPYDLTQLGLGFGGATVQIVAEQLKKVHGVAVVDGLPPSALQATPLVRELLAELARQEIPMALVWNYDPQIREALESLGSLGVDFAPYFVPSFADSEIQQQIEEVAMEMAIKAASSQKPQNDSERHATPIQKYHGFSPQAVELLARVMGRSPPIVARCVQEYLKNEYRLESETNQDWLKNYLKRNWVTIAEGPIGQIILKNVEQASAHLKALNLYDQFIEAFSIGQAAERELDFDSPLSAKSAVDDRIAEVLSAHGLARKDGGETVLNGALVTNALIDGAKR